MYSIYGAQQIYEYEEKRIIKSGAVGTTNLEEIQWLTKNMLKISEKWREVGWGYVCCIGGMTPVTAEESAALVELHKKIEEANCKAIGFVNPDAFAAADSFVIGVQAKQHQKKSKASYKEKHFRTEEEAIVWLEKQLAK